MGIFWGVKEHLEFHLEHKSSNGCYFFISFNLPSRFCLSHLMWAHNCQGRWSWGPFQDSQLQSVCRGRSGHTFLQPVLWNHSVARKGKMALQKQHCRWASVSDPAASTSGVYCSSRAWEGASSPGLKHGLLTCDYQTHHAKNQPETNYPRSLQSNMSVINFYFTAFPSLPIMLW